MNVQQTAIDAALAGGKVLLQYRRDGVTIRDKTASGGKSYDLVSDADLESERVIVDIIRSHYPDHAILGEEAFQDADRMADHLWVIDPLDGTNNFAHGMDHFAVSIGYYQRGKAITGVVWNPARDDLFTASAGEGAFHNGRRRRVSEVKTLDHAMVGCGFYYDRGQMMRSTLAAIEACFERQIHGIRRFGTASLDLCLVATGQLDAFFEFNLSPWDFAAGALIVAEAGGRVTTCVGEPIPLTPTSVLVSNGNVHSAMLEITQSHFRPS